MCELVAHGASLGAHMSCVTNAFWASSEARAQQRLGRLKAAGLGLLAVSCSRYHLDFVPASRVERALRLAGEQGMERHLKYVYTRQEWACPEQGSLAWARSLPVDCFQPIPLLPHVREGVALATGDFPQGDSLPLGPCPAAAISIREDGQAYTCCTPGAFTPFFALGDTAQDGLALIHHRFRFGPLQQILRRHGPAHFVEAIRARGQGARLRSHYVDVCELCAHIANEPALRAIAQDSARDYGVAQLREILDQSVQASA